MKFRPLLLAACALLIYGCATVQPSSPVNGQPTTEPNHPAAIALWPMGAPGAEGKAGEKEQVVYKIWEGITYISVTNINTPTLTPFLPERDRATGTAVIIAPGGGHTNLAIDTEGYNVAQWFADHGVAAFVLKYRLARQTGSTYTVERDSVGDALRAVQLVRSRAGEWGVNPNGVGVLGFSAGGEVVARAAMAHPTRAAHPADAVDEASTQINFQVLVYPGAANAITAEGAPPTFMVSASDDRAISDSVANLYLRLHQASVPVEMHVFASGAHGFGLGNFKSPLPHAWPMLLMSWLADQRFVSAKK